jgi:PhnB protein
MNDETARAAAERLEDLVSQFLSGRAQASPTDSELAGLIEVADALRGMPDESFRAHLSAQIERRTAMTSTTGHVPVGLGTVTPFLIVTDAVAAIELYKDVFGAWEVDRTSDPAGRFVHATLRIGDSMVEMGQHAEVSTLDLERLPPVGMHLHVEDVHAVVARAQAAGVRVLRPIERQPYGDLEASLADPFGIVWWVATHVGDASSVQ